MSLDFQWYSLKLLRHLCDCQSFGFWHKIDGEIQKVGCRADKDQKGERLSVLQQNGKGKGDEPIGNPIDENSDRHGRISSIEWKDLRNAVS